MNKIHVFVAIDDVMIPKLTKTPPNDITYPHPIRSHNTDVIHPTNNDIEYPIDPIQANSSKNSSTIRGVFRTL